jgi:hypothetical protein
MFKTLPLLLALAPWAQAGTIYLTNSQNQLLAIDSATPGTVVTSVGITGLQSGEAILGIDFRPATSQLFALGSTSRLYTIDAGTGAATAVGSAGAFTLSGTSFGFDFNPTVDRIRVVSNTGQNLRLNPATGGLAATDAALNPGTPSGTAAGYTNSFAGTGSTTLYVIDDAADTLSIQNPPNDGTLVPVGALGINITAVSGFDIGFPGNMAFGAFSVAGGPAALYNVNLSNGAASLVGTIGAGQTITGLAVAPVPEPSTFLLSCLGIGAAVWVRRRFYWS